MKITSGDLFIKTWFRKHKSSTKNSCLDSEIYLSRSIFLHIIFHIHSFTEKINIFTFRIILKFITKIIIIKYYDEIENKIININCLLSYR